MKFRYLTFILPIFLQPLAGQADDDKNEEGFKTATVSNYLASKYIWEEVKEEEKPKVVVENKTPIKPLEQRIAEKGGQIEARLQPTLDIDDPTPQTEIPEEMMGLDTVNLREFQVNELYSPLMRMSELKDINKLDPSSGGQFLAEEYFSNFENRYLNRWHIPLIGKSQEELAKERYQQQQYQNFLGSMSETIEGLESLNPTLAKQLKKEVNQTKQQYNNNNKIDDSRFSGPDARF